MDTSKNVKVGDKIPIETNKLYAGIILLVIGVLFICCGYGIYKAITANKYMAAESVLFQPSVMRF
jgi:hypothetical protein